MPVIRASQRDRGFVVIANAVIDDQRLSWAARGMLAHLLGKPATWNVNVQALINETKGTPRSSGRDAVYRTLEELAEAGYLVRRRQADGTIVTTVYEDPLTDNPDVAVPNASTRHPHPENPDEGSEPHPEKPDPEKPDRDFPDVLVNTIEVESTDKAKKNLSRTLRERFERFWQAYPRKKSKGAAEKAFAKLAPDEQLLAAMLAGLGRAKTSEQWRTPRYIPHASTWLAAAGWLDEVQTAYSDAELAVIDAYNTALGDRLGRADPALFVEARAGAIRALLEHLKGDIDAAARYFPAVRDRVELPPRVGFDYLIGPKGFGDVTGKLQRARAAGATVPGIGADWHTTTAGIEAQAVVLGVAKREEEPFPIFKQRVFKAAGEGEWMRDHLANERRFGEDAYERLRAYYYDQPNEGAHA